MARFAMAFLFYVSSTALSAVWAQGDVQPSIEISPTVENPSRHLDVTGRLTDTNLKRAFVAKQLRVDPRSIGLSKPVTLYPARGDLHRANRYSTQINGDISVMTWQNTINFGRGAHYFLYIEPAFEKNVTHYLVVATVRGSGGRTRLITKTSQGPHGFADGEVALDGGFQPVNLVVPRTHERAVVILWARERGWTLQKIEITPVQR